MTSITCVGGDPVSPETDARCSENARNRRSHFHVAAVLIAVLGLLIVTALPGRSQTVDELANPEEAARKCRAELNRMNYSCDYLLQDVSLVFCDRGALRSCKFVLEGGPDFYGYADKVEPAKARVEQANTLAWQWHERYNLLTSLCEQADAECRSSFPFAAACQSRDRYQLQREEAVFNQRKAEEIGKRLEKEYKDAVHDRDTWAWAYQYCKDLQNRVGPCPDLQVRENQEQKCKNLEAIAQQFRPGRASGPTAPPAPTKTTQTTTNPPAPTGRTVKIGYINYQKLRNFSVTINGTTKDCSSGNDQRDHQGLLLRLRRLTSLPQGSGGLQFRCHPGPCFISVQASGYVTVKFDYTCNKDETLTTTLSKAP